MGNGWERVPGKFYRKSPETATFASAADRSPTAKACAVNRRQRASHRSRITAPPQRRASGGSVASQTRGACLWQREHKAKGVSGVDTDKTKAMIVRREAHSALVCARQ